MINIQEELPDGTFLYGWNSDEPLTPFAPSYTHFITDKKIFTEEECEEWYKYLLEQEQVILNKFRISAGDGNTGLGNNSITARYPFFNLLKFDFHLVPKLKTEILDGVRTLLHISGNTNWHKTLHTNCWFNVLRMEENMETHFHGYHKNIFYGFNLTIGAKQTFTSYYHPVTYPHDEKGAFHVPNRPGYLTLFPHFIPHGVSTNKHSEPRISIAGDIHSQSWFNDPHRKIAVSNFVEIGTS